MSVIDNYKLIIEKINQQSNKKIILVAVSKTFPLSHIKSLIDYGHQHYGENKVQEALSKWSDYMLSNDNIKLHMVGSVQSNKIESAVRIFSYIHSLDNEKSAYKFASAQKKFNKELNYFIQVNIGNETQKSGVKISLVNEFVKFCQQELKLNILGLMCIPPLNLSADQYFKKLKELNEISNLKNLSMCMSLDYVLAIKYGANYIRIGSSLFGKRS
jgi:pyridoxal phosphate enzyme (YggS family)